MKRLAITSSSFATAIALAVETAAAAPVPAHITIQGLLRDDAALAMSGNFDLTFTLYDDPVAGTVVYSEPHVAVPSDGGVFAVTLGETVPLTAELLATYTDLWLGVAIEDPMTPGPDPDLPGRVKLTAQAYALQSERANRADSAVNADTATNALTADLADDSAMLGGLGPLDWQRRVGGSCSVGQAIREILADGTVTCETDDDTTYSATAPIAIVGSNIGLSSGACTAGEIWKWNGSAWSCDPDANTTYTASGALQLVGTDVRFATSGCLAGELWKYDGTMWNCVPDDNTTYTSGAGISLSGTTISLSSTGCMPGYLWRYNGTSWDCVADANTVYSGGAGIAVSSSTISLSTSGCSAGDVWRWNGSAWSCDPDLNTTYTGGAGISVSGTTVSLANASCGAGEIWKWDGSAWDCVPDANNVYTGGSPIVVSGLAINLSTTGCAAGEVWKWSGTAWSCDPDIDTDTNTTYTASGAIAMSGTDIRLATTGCVSGDVWKWNGTAWSCDPDVDTDTTYTASGAIAISATDIRLATTGCVSGDVWKWNGTAWSCDPDDNAGGDITGVTAGSGLSGGGTTGSVTLSVDTTTTQARVSGTCAAGSSIRVINGDGTVTCEPDDDTNTTYTASGAVAMSGTDIRLSTTGCAAGEIWKWNGTTWSCDPDVDTNTTYTASGAITISGTDVQMATTGCAAGEVWKWNGTAWSCDPDDNAGGDITSVTAGTGLSGGGTSGAVTINVDTTTTQSRVSGSCAAGSSIRVINGDGTVTCEPDDDTNTTYTASGAVTMSGTDIRFATTGCVAGEVWKWNGTAWSCDPDDNAGGDITGVTAGSGLSGGGTSGSVTLSVDTTTTQSRVSGTCGVGSAIRVINENGTVTCETDDDTTYTASGAVTMSGSDIRFSTTGCVAGEVWKWNGTAWSCDPDDNAGGDITSVTAGSGLTGGGTSGAVTVNVDTTTTQSRVSGSCAAGASIRVINENGTVTCETDDNTTYSASGAVTISGTDIRFSTTGCAAGEVWKWDGTAWNCVADDNTTYTTSGAVAMSGTDIRFSTTGCVAGEVWKWDGTAWNCVADDNTTYTASGAVTMSGTDIRFSTTGCVAGEVWKWDGAAWGCVPDNDTTYTGSSPISISGTTVSLSTTGCSAGEVWEWDGTAWGCVPDDDLLGQTACGDFQVMRYYTGFGWLCDVTYHGGGVTVQDDVDGFGNPSGTLSVVAESLNSTHLATNSVGADEIATNAVGADEIATNAVGTAEIADNAVNASKISDEPALKGGADGCNAPPCALGTTETTIASVSITAPAAGHLLVQTQATWNLAVAGTTTAITCRLLDGATQLDSWKWDPGDNDGVMDMMQSRSTAISTTSGARTLNLACATNTGSVSYEQPRAIAAYFPSTM